MLRRLMMAGAGEAQTTLDPGLTHATLVLQNGNREVRSTQNASGQSLSASAKSSGKFYAEFEIVQQAGGGNWVALAAGIRPSTTGLDQYLGLAGNEFGSWVEGTEGQTRDTYTGGAAWWVSNAFTNPGPGTRMRMAVHVGVAVWFSYWSSTAWIGVGDPAAGTSPTHTMIPGAYRLSINPRGSGQIIRLVNPDNWASAPPAGFGIWT